MKHNDDMNACEDVEDDGGVDLDSSWNVGVYVDMSVGMYGDVRGNVCVYQGVYVGCGCECECGCEYVCRF